MSWVTMTTVERIDLDDAGQLVLQARARQRVEGAERLVEQQHARRRRQRARDADPLLHSARNLERIFVHGVLEMNEVSACSTLSSSSAASGCGRTPASPPGGRSRSRSSRAATRGSGRPWRDRGPGPRIGFCSQTMRPELGNRSPPIRFKSVLLPQPEWPMRQTNSFLATSSEIESRARKRAVAFDRERHRHVAYVEKGRHAFTLGSSASCAVQASAESRASPTIPISTIATIMLASCRLFHSFQMK